MTESDKEIRANTAMKPFNFYLDDITKLNVLKRLRGLGLDTAKGSISALIRVLLNYFAQTDDTKFVLMMSELIKDEYIFTTKKNKRSKL